jgi:serine/threonine protein kinase
MSGEGEGDRTVVSARPIMVKLDNGTCVAVDYDAPLGKGKFGEVFLAHEVGGERVYAAKVIEKEIKSSKWGKSEPLEAEILRKLGGIVAPKLHGAIYAEEKVILVMERCGKSLDKASCDSKGALYDVDEIREIGLRCLSILESIHAAGYIHGDIKPANFGMSCT